MGIDCSICIPTFKRPEMLLDLLQTIENQKNSLIGHEYEVIVIDNDPEQSAIKVIEKQAKTFSFRLVLVPLAIPSISEARNLCVKHSQGDFIYFIDDDQLILEGWLTGIRQVMSNQSAMIGGLVSRLEPKFERPLIWPLRSAKCYNRRRFETGTKLSMKNCRTGGVLLRKQVFETMHPPFNLALASIGGEDTDFFSRAQENGWEFVAYDDIPIIERYPIDRCKLSFIYSYSMKIGFGRAKRTRIRRNGKPLLLFSLQSFAKMIAAFSLSVPLIILAPPVGLWAIEYSLRNWGAFLGSVGPTPQYYGNTN